MTPETQRLIEFECFMEHAETIRSALSEQGALKPVHDWSVPAGMVLVPIEPTEEMISAGNKCDFPIVSDIYKAMISAAKEGG
jgi:hypothetical protein